MHQGNALKIIDFMRRGNSVGKIEGEVSVDTSMCVVGYVLRESQR